VGIAIGFRQGSSTTISGITIGGASLVQVPGAYVYNGNADFSDFWQTSAPLSEPSGDVQVTYSQAINGAGSAVVLYCVVTTTPTAANAGNDQSLFGSSATLNLNVPSGGAGAVVPLAEDGTPPTSTTNWAIDAKCLVRRGNIFWVIQRRPDQGLLYQLRSQHLPLLSLLLRGDHSRMIYIGPMHANPISSIHVAGSGTAATVN